MENNLINKYKSHQALTDSCTRYGRVLMTSRLEFSVSSILFSDNIFAHSGNVIEGINLNRIVPKVFVL